MRKRATEDDYRPLPKVQPKPFVKIEKGLGGNTYRLYLLKCRMCFKKDYCFRGICDKCYDLMESPLPTKKVVMIAVPREADDGS